MRTDRRTILHLIALGRITPAEAERLLIAWNEEREVVWVFAACAAALILPQVNLHELLPALERAVHALPVSGSRLFHHVLALVICLFGGVL